MSQGIHQKINSKNTYNRSRKGSLFKRIYSRVLGFIET